MIWEVKSVQGLRSQFHSYYASASRKPERPAQCEPGQEDCLAVTYTEAVNKQKLCGFEDSEDDIAAERGWRLPTERELKTLLDWSQYDRSRGLPAMDRHAFPDAEAAFYWTATSRRGEGAVAVAFDDTHRTLSSVSLSLGQPARLRLVRGPKLADDPNPEDNPPPQPAYIPVSADGQLAAPAQAACVDDNLHPDSWRDIILWQARPRPASAASLNPALAALQQQRLCQQDNWRLPSVIEAIRWLQLQQDQGYPAANAAAARVWGARRERRALRPGPKRRKTERGPFRRPGRATAAGRPLHPAGQTAAAGQRRRGAGCRPAGAMADPLQPIPARRGPPSGLARAHIGYSGASRFPRSGPAAGGAVSRRQPL
ncbi:DUF1566 domain-containing protein [Chromobacterium haemolyticum]|nr:DUF1566 domain-containing protein [Chromobacterium haemolyticum]